MTDAHVSYIKVRVTTQSPKPLVICITPKEFKIRVKSAPVNNMANLELIKLVAAYYQIKRSQVTIVSGFSSRDKLLRLDF